MTTTAYKVLTHDLRQPIQGGEPVITGPLPFVLPRTKVDESTAACAAGWNACAKPEFALRIAGLWPNGRPSRLFRVETDEPVLERGDRLRAAAWTMVEEIADVRPAVLAMSAPFGDMAEVMADEQMAWRVALARPGRDAPAVEVGLTAALNARKLPWTLKRFDSAWDARDARAAWDAWAARAAWYARGARDAWDARGARDARAARDAWDAWDAWDALDARAARDALTVFYAASRRWFSSPHDLLTVGIRDAYAAGLALAIPTGPNELGWAMMGERANDDE